MAGMHGTRLMIAVKCHIDTHIQDRAYIVLFSLKGHGLFYAIYGPPREPFLSNWPPSMLLLFYKELREAEPGAQEGPGGTCHFRRFFCKQMPWLSAGSQAKSARPLSLVVMLCTGQDIMKKLSMGIAALITIAPAPFVIEAIFPNPIVAILIIIVLSWMLVEFYIGLSRPCKGQAPSHMIVKIGRMVWPLFIVYSWLDFRNNWTRLLFPSWFYALIILICIFALLLRIWAVIHLGESFSYDVKSPEGGILITTGPYSIVRHPAYLAVCILGSFPGLILGSILGFIGMLATTVPTIVYRINAEEQMLQKEFGDLFIKYKRKTYRLFPFIY